jgi:uncharacterized protein YjhX (UPF0386 family)
MPVEEGVISSVALAAFRRWGLTLVDVDLAVIRPIKPKPPSSSPYRATPRAMLQIQQHERADIEQILLVQQLDAD